MHLFFYVPGVYFECSSILLAVPTVFHFSCFPGITKDFCSILDCFAFRLIYCVILLVNFSSLEYCTRQSQILSVITLINN